MLFNGANAAEIVSDETFYNLNLDKTYPSFDGLELFNDVTVANDLHVMDGSMELNYQVDLFITGNVTIDDGVGINANDHAAQITVGKNWTNANTGISIEYGFDPGAYSTVTFNGAADQFLTTACTQEDFNNITIDKPSGKFKSNDNIQVSTNLLIQNGIWEDNIDGLHHSVYRDFTVGSNGTFNNYTNKNTVTFSGNGPSVLTYSGTSGYFHNLVIDKLNAASVTQLSSIYCHNNGALTVDNGIYNLNGYAMSVFDNVNINNGGKLLLPAGSALILSDIHNLNVNAGGILEANGTDGNNTEIMANIPTAHYNLTVNGGGTISAEYCKFMNMGANGVYVAPGAIVSPAHPFTGCTFQDGAAGGTLLALNNDQVLTIRNANFPTNTWSGGSNVAKTLNTGHVYFVDYTGGYSGENYDADGWNLIDWVPTLTATATATPGTICSGSSSQLNTIAEGGFGSYTYSWSPTTGLSNPSIPYPVATPAATTTYFVTVTDNLATQTTSSILLTVMPVLPVSVSITASANPSPPGNLVTFTATPVNGGPLPSYQWKVNDVNVGTGLPTYSYVPANNNQVKCILTSNYVCPSGNPATSNTITMIIVNTNSTAAGTIPNGTTVCYDASNTITVGGAGGAFTVQSGGIANLIAGAKILYQYGTTVQPGGYMHGWITTTNGYCGSLPLAMVAVVAGEEEVFPVPSTASRRFIIYPNPTTGAFTLMSTGDILPCKVQAVIFDMHGGMVFTTSYTGEKSHGFSVRGLPPGVYFLKVITDNRIESL